LAFSERLQNISAVGGQQHSTTAAVLVYQAHLEKIISWERWICSISRDGIRICCSISLLTNLFMQPNRATKFCTVSYATLEIRMFPYFTDIP